MGQYRKVLRQCRKVVGQYRKALGLYQEVVGQYRKILGRYQEVLGQCRKALGQYKEVLGQYLKNLGQCGKVLGEYQEVLRQCGKVLGQYQEVFEQYRKVLGQCRKLLGQYQEVLGHYQAEISCAIQSKLDAILRNSTSQDKPVTYRTQGNRVDFVEPQRNKRESTPLRYPGRSEHRTRGGQTIMKSETSNTTNGPGDSTTSNNVGPDAMTWVSTW